MADRLFLTNADFNLNQAKNLLAHILASDPVSPTEGQIWYNSTSHQIKYYNGTSTIVLYDAATTSTASKLVLRDSSGDFAAHDITANKVTGLATPTGTSDAATKAYVDALLNGLDWKASVRVATTVAGTLASSFANGSTVDGVTLATGDRILIKDQSSGAENGVYTVNASGAPTRATDADASAEVTGGLAVWVNEGSTNGDTGWVLSTNDPITLGSTALTFVQFSGGATRASLGLATTDSPQFAALNIGHASDTTLSRTGAGDLAIEGNAIYRAGGTDVPVLDGGTGSSTAAGARTNLGATGKYSATVGDNSATSITITQATHGLAADGTNSVHVYDATSGVEVFPGVTVAPGTGNVTLTFSVAPTTNQYRVVIKG